MGVGALRTKHVLELVEDAQAAQRLVRFKYEVMSRPSPHSIGHWG